MHRVLEFSLIIFITTIINSAFAFYVATVVGNRITELFETLVLTLAF